MVGRWTLVAAAALSFALGGCGGESPPDDELPPDPVEVTQEMFGINGHVLRAMSAAGEDEELVTQLAAIRAGGIRFVRASVDWVQLEPAPPEGARHTYDFAGLDRWVVALARNDLRWYAVGLGASTPVWAVSPEAAGAGCGGRSPPADPGLVASMMEAVAERYGRDGRFWRENPGLPELPVVDYEIWNEENHGAFWCPMPNPAAYAEMVAQASPVIHGVDGKARVVFGGLAPFDKTVAPAAGVAGKMEVGEFMAAVVAAEPHMPELVDAVGIHTYGDPSIILNSVTWYREILRQVGMADTPMSLNEVGWATAGTGVETVSEEERAEYMTEITDTVVRSDCNVISFAPHTWVTDEEDSADPEDWFGLASPEDGSPYPAGIAYLEILEEAAAERRFKSSEVETLCGQAAYEAAN